ncbi:MAG: BrnA antitoxin family protein [Ignavibacteria bacterium]|nr:BrnA antitoxin family protein [Ignavibacteria bacterium]
MKGKNILKTNSKKFKAIPEFKNEDEEREFWAKEDSTKYIDWSAAQRVVFPNLKYSTESISIRMPSSILDRIKAMANERDVPYQSLIKMILADRVEEELAKYKIKKNI